MRTSRFIIWGSAIIAAGVLFVVDRAGLFPQWLLVGPVILGVAGVALLADQIVFTPGRKGGFFASLMMIALSAATVTQDAELVVDNWSVWPFVAGAVLLGVPLEMLAAHHRHIGPSAGAHAG
ncbi:MAG: LiaF transmembrane domain-containing protein [Actinomycetota bacterium]